MVSPALYRHERSSSAATDAANTSCNTLTSTGHSLFLDTLNMRSSNDIVGGEVNADLSERFCRATPFTGSSVPNDNVPASEPVRPNQDIRDYLQLAKKPVISGAWLRKPEIPTSSEVLCVKSDFSNSEQNLIEIEENIRPHKIEGAYENKEDYLRTTYELLREDAIRPLREALDEFRADPFKDEAEYNNQGIGVYDPVYITSVVFSPRGLATRVAFSLGRVKKHVRWEQSKRLVTGTLVALSPTDNAFQTQCALAIVAARPLSALEQNPPEIDLFFARPEDQEIDPMRKYMMVECRTSFFEASRHTLLALQHMMRETFPLSKYLVYAQKEVEPPAYIKHNPYVNLSSLVSMEESAEYENVNVLEDWPTMSSHSLDRSQSKALKRMLTSELAIVQGPPGTGKTFVSVVALQIIRDNLRKEDSPVIVTAQTNHALDQLLRHTSQFEPNYIRLGGRSKDKEIKKRTLFEVRSAISQQKQPGSLKVQANIAMRKLTAQCQLLLAPLEANKGPLDHKLLLSLNLITEEQAASLEMESQCTMGISATENPGILMEQWLGRCIAPCDRPIGPDQFDWGYEEEEDFEVEQLKELEAEAVAQDDDDIEALRGQVTLLSDNYRGTGKGLSNADIQDMLRKSDDMYTIPVVSRGAVYNYFKREVKKKITAAVRGICKQYQDTVDQRKVGQWEEDVCVLRKARIIGCTTTGLAKYRALLSGLRPRICVVEEAAETLEAPITVACLPTLEHLVLVGDHQQLRPHTQVRAFEDEPYFLNLSLFERLVSNDVAFDTLTRQRRMIPEIRRLLYPIYEDTLKDHKMVKDVSNRPPVEGMGGNNSFFFCHEWPESRDANMSAVNTMEAQMLVQFLNYLVLNGVDATKITVLTFYNGQRKHINRELRKLPDLRTVAGIQVVTVDSYQGEENDIVLLSLVRSNRNHSIGFLSSENRACVALSRAKRGFYIFGNAELLACESGTWASVVDIMYRNKKSPVTTGQERRLGYRLPLVCSNHGQKIWCEYPSDFDLIKGGCDKKCEGSLPCGHRCPFTCHPFEHDMINCTQKCSKRVEACGHPCVAECCDPCKCTVCERRSGGVKSTLKPAKNGATSFRAPRSNTRNAVLEDMVLRPGPSAPVTDARTPRMASGPLVDRVTEQWEPYVNGGAQEDDQRVFEMRKEQEARYRAQIRSSTPAAGPSSAGEQLIQISPEKKATVSKNTNLLLDLDFEPLPVQERHDVRRSSADPAVSNVAKSTYINLLD
ncbi:Superfamily I DNA and RNA helicase and helicase subunits [Pyrenophora tritici-repentis]|nr:Superfamily I DNA and RNA helicase and helicase subunit [Pyrenophora tritici-repentis]KAI0608095.1 Superfamily I DNA and RNA helicase and helicase subunit [Pyrenophora tritici-repentis]KAI0620368.1 Superfamily I DNA and RNA helicase and helicase subunit [Pyrenophora tritici-repentis]KAI1529144.1 Superfamily I DNA and RNA helicase [Pyrenophora tritici-repentis]KAI1537646.1 Superfamily I DNA and RNA helicase and helicase subunits [Pyrenophora tritici-repentis]